MSEATFWTPERLTRARGIIDKRREERRTHAEIAAELSVEFGVPVTRYSIPFRGTPQGAAAREAGAGESRDTMPDLGPAEAYQEPLEAEPKSKGKIHVVIPDTQVSVGTPTAHLGWIGRYLVDQFEGQDLTIIHLGDHWDMPSLSTYDKGTARIEGRRYKRDIEAGNIAFALLNRPLLEAKAKTGWAPAKHFLRGNHEDRITRASNLDAQLLGVIALEDLDTSDWKVHPFLEPVFLDGVGYSHYWYQPLTGKPYGGMIETRLKTIGHSFTMGHQQTLLYGVRYVAGASQHGLVCGSCYTHDEEYKGPQGNSHWRGIIVKHRVSKGSYDPMFVSLNYLRDRYA